jgi:hypothetical protein
MMMMIIRCRLGPLLDFDFSLIAISIIIQLRFAARPPARYSRIANSGCTPA